MSIVRFDKMAKEESVNKDGGVWVRGNFLGKGSFGSVHLAHFPSESLPLRYQNFPPIVAVKSTLTSDFKFLIHEKSIFDALGDSPFLIRCFGDDQTTSSSGQDFYNLFLEYASGGSLWNFLMNSNGFGLLKPQVREITRSILGGLDHMHRLGYAHCDIKPENVLLVKDDSELGFAAKIADFGLTTRDECTCLAKNIQRKEYDIWALGCVVLSMLTGSMEYWDLGLDFDMYSCEHPNINVVTIDFLSKCLNWDREQRRTAAELLSHPFVTECFSEEYQYLRKEEEYELMRLIEDDPAYRSDHEDRDEDN